MGRNNMKKRNYFNFVFVKLLIGVLVGAAVFVSSFEYLKKLYNGTIEYGLSEYNRSIEDLIEVYESDGYSYAVRESERQFGAADYFRLVKIGAAGRFDTLYETRYDYIPVYVGMNRIYIAVDPDTPLEEDKIDYYDEYDVDAKNVISYRKCDELIRILNRQDTAILNSYELLYYSGAFRIGNDFFNALSLFNLYTRYSDISIESYYTDDEYLHPGKVVEKCDYVEYVIQDYKKPFSKTWDFTDESKKDEYINSDEFAGIPFYIIDGGENISIIYSVGCETGKNLKRPDKYFEKEGNLFLITNKNDLYESANPPSNITMFNSNENYSSEVDLEGGRKSYGYISLFYSNGERYMYEYVITYLTFEEYFKPFFIVMAIVLLILCAGIPCLSAIKPYKKYKASLEESKVSEEKADARAVVFREPLHEIGKYAKDLRNADDEASKDSSYFAILSKLTELEINIDSNADEDKLPPQE